jgi:O-antigen ligase
MFWAITLFVISYIFLSWQRLDWALAVLIFLLPTYQIRFHVGLLPTTLLEVMVLILFAVWFIQTVQKKELPLFNTKLRNVKHYPFYVEIILLLIIAFIAAGVSGFSSTSLGILKAYFIEPILFYIVFINVYKLKQNRNKIFIALAASALVVSVLAIYQKLTGQFLPPDWVGTGRVTGVFPYPNALGLYLGPILIILTGWFLSFRVSNGKIKLIEILFFCFFVFLFFLAILFAQSQGALAGLAVAFIIIGLWHNAWSRRAVVAVLIIGALVLSFNAGLRHSFVKKVTLMDTDGQIRQELWQETWQMLRDGKLLFGAGLANYQAAVEPHHVSGIYVRNDDPEFDKWVAISLEYQQKVWQPLEIYLYPHNIFLNFWSELGLAGMLLFCWMIGKFIIIAYQLQKKEIFNIKYLILGLLGAMIVIVVQGLVDVPYFKNDLAILFWLIVGILGVLNLEIRNQK